MTNAEIGRRIRALRQASGLSLRAFGQLFDPPVSHVAASALERGKTKPDIERLTRIAGILGTSLSDLLSTPVTEQRALVYCPFCGERLPTEGMG